MVKLARKYGFMVISDFAYADVAFDGYQPPSFLASPGAADVGVEFTTMSKGYNMAGWRVGFCSRQREMIQALATIKGYYDYGMFQAIQIAAIMALRHGDAGDGAAGRGSTRAAATRCATACSDSAGTSTPPKASMFCWVPIPEPWRSRDEHDGLRHDAAWKRATSPSAPAAASARPAKAFCGCRSSKTKPGCGRPCGRSSAASAKRRAQFSGHDRGSPHPQSTLPSQRADHHGVALASVRVASQNLRRTVLDAPYDNCYTSVVTWSFRGVFSHVSAN